MPLAPDAAAADEVGSHARGPGCLQTKTCPVACGKERL